MINIDALNDDEKLAALESIHKSIAESKEIQKKKITTNVEMILKALKKIEGDLKQRYDETGNLIANLKNGTDGRDGKDGKDGRAGKDGAMGPRGYDGLPGRNGLDGEDGVSITDAHIDFDGSLIISLSTGRVINVGEVVTADIAERIKVITNGGGTSQYVLDTLASLQSQISSITSGLDYQGTWNASTNVPTLASSVGTAGYYYIVATAGSTNLNGITDWQVGDWAVFNGSVWQKLDQTNLVTSVAGRTGAIVLTTSDIGGLGTIATQASSNVSITGGSITGITDLAIADGGTGQSTANAAFNALAPSQTSNSGKYLTTDGTNTSWATSASGTVTSVAASVPTFLSVSGSPITTSGTLAITLSGTALPTANGGTGLTSFTSGGVPYATSTSALTTGAELTFNGTNIGVGVALSSWTSSHKAIQLGDSTSSGAIYQSTSGLTLSISSNEYISATGPRYINTAPANRFLLGNGIHSWYTAASGTAGTSISYTQAMILDASGNLYINSLTASKVVFTDASKNLTSTGTVAIAQGGTGTTTPALVAGTNVTITGTWPNQTINSSNTGGTVTSVGGTGTVNGLTLTGTVTTSGNLTLGGTLSGVANSALTNSSITIGGTAIALGASSNALANDITINSLTVGRGAGAVSTNTAVGASALAQNTTGTRNAAGGWGSLFSNTTGASNTGFGHQSGFANTTGSANSAFGDAALVANTTGGNNTALGYFALQANTTASNNTAVGYQAGYTNVTGTVNTFIGYQAGYSNTVSGNVFVGAFVGQNNSTGIANVGVGGAAVGVTNTTFQANTTGSYNTILGAAALQSNTTASNNTAVGYQSGYNNTASNNAFFANYSGYSTTTGTQNSFIGRTAGYSNTTGSFNTYVGDNAGYYTTTGSKNTIIGDYNGNQGGLDIRTASNYIVLSDGDGNPRGIFDGSGNFMVGTTSADPIASAVAGISLGSDKIIRAQAVSNPSGIFGRLTTTGDLVRFYYSTSITLVGSISTNGTTTSYNTTSDQRLKENIQDSDAASNLIDSLQVRKFDWKANGSHQRYGFVAQELITVAPEAVNQPENTKEMMAVDYSKLVPMLVKEIQSLRKRLADAGL